MKKIISLVMVVLCLMLATPAKAQLHFGVKGGLNLSKVTLSESDLKGDNKTGWFIGPMAEFTVPLIGIGVDASALYTQNKLAVDDTASSDATLKTIEVPVNLKWTFGLGSVAGVYVAAGPQFGFNIDKKSTLNYDLKKNNTSFNVGAGVKLISHLQVGLNYNFALSKTATVEVDNKAYEVKNNSWQVSAAYIF
jgi:opacity protein-like surface antigen